MSIIISCINHKGGVGKTTVCAHLGYALAALHGQRVLLVDVDSQANLTRFFYAANEVEWSLTDVLTGTCSVQDALCTPQPNLTLLPASLNLTNVEHVLTTDNNYYALGDILRPILGNFDVVLMDCPPSLMTMTMNAMHVSTDVCVITTTDRLALEGIGAIIQAVEQVQRTNNPYLAVSSVIVSHYEQRKTVAREGLTMVQNNFTAGTVMQPSVPYSVVVQEAIWHTKTVFQYKKSSPVTLAFTELANAFAARYGLASAPVLTSVKSSAHPTQASTRGTRPREKQHRSRKERTSVA